MCYHLVLILTSGNLTGTALAEHEVVGTEELTERTSTDGVHCAGLQVDEDGARNIFVAGSLNSKSVLSMDWGELIYIPH